MRFLILSLILLAVVQLQAQTSSNLAQQTPKLLENRGQLSNSDGTRADQVLYYMNTPRLDFFVTTKGITYVFKNGLTEKAPEGLLQKNDEPDPVTQVQWHRVDVTPQGGKMDRQQIEIIYSKQGGVSIYNQNVPDGLTDLRPIESLTIKNVYPGIDWQFVVQEDNLKYNFILQKGADISQIKLLFEGQDELKLENNMLLVKTSLGTLAENKIESFTSKGVNVDVKPVLEKNILTYSVAQMPELATGETLTIDPPLVWATYFGGSIDDYAEVMERNANGYIFVLMRTTSNAFPLLDPNASTFNYYNGTYNANGDLAIVKFTENGVLTWSTYYGGSGNDIPYNLFYNGTALLIVGSTESTDFPYENALGGYGDNIHNGGTRDGFILGFMSSPIGEVRFWSTYFGGSAYDEIKDCSIKGSRVVVTGHTFSSDLPVLANGTSYFDNSFGGVNDVFLAEFNVNTAAQTWSTYFGGTGVEQDPYFDIDSLGRIGMTCTVTSTDFPLSNSLAGCYYDDVQNSGSDLGIVIFDANRQLTWASYYGSTGNEWANDIICNSQNEWFLVGNSTSALFPVVNNIGAGFYQPTKGAGTDAIFLKFGNNGQQLYSSFYGGGGNDVAMGITIDSHKNTYFVGYTASNNLLTYDPADGSYYDNTFNLGVADNFLVELDSNFNMKWATYLGGTLEERINDVRVSPSDHVFAVGWSKSINHPTQNMTGAYFNNTLGGTRDAIIMKFIPCPEDFNTIHFVDSVCYGENTLLYSTGSDTYTWNLGSTNDSITATIVSDTSFSVVATYLTCIERDTARIVVKPLPVIAFSGDASVCLNDTMRLGASGGTVYNWEHGYSGDSITFVPAASENLVLTVTNVYNCTAADSVAITVYPLPVPTVTGDTEVCRLDTITVTAGGGTSYVWSTSETTPAIDIHYSVDGTYDYFVIATDGNACSDTAFYSVDVLPLPEFNLGNDTTICFGTSIWLNTGIPGASYSWNTTATTQSISVNSALLYIAQVTDANTCVFRDSIDIGIQPLPVVNFSGDTTICLNDTLYLNASGGVVYNWENGLSGNPIAFVPTNSDTLSVTVTDSYFCTTTDSVSYIVYPLPVPGIVGDAEICKNDTAHMTASGGLSYVWSNSLTGATLNLPLTVQGTHIYFAIATDINGCSDTAFHQVLVNPLPVFNLGNDTTLCLGNSLLLQVPVSPANYNWSTSEITQSISVNTANNYSVEVTDTNTCHYADTIAVAVIPYADASITDVAYVCQNAVPFNFTAAETGGTWTGDGISNAANGTYTASTTSVGFHTVYYLIGGLCGDSDSSVIEVAEVPTASFVATDENCLGANDGTLELTVSGGQAPYVYLLDTTYINLSNTGLAPGAFLLAVVDNRGCMWTDSVYIIAEAFPCGEVDFYVPNIFSPNGDGQNDVLQVRSNFITTMMLVVYDRFGEKVFTSTDIANGWDGKYNGQPVTAGVYYYFIKADMIDGSYVERKGNITLVR